MTLLGNGLRRLIILALIIICAVLVALNIILNIKLRADIPIYIDKFSTQSGYQIGVEKIGLDSFFRLQLDKVTVVDPQSETKDVLDIDRVTVEPVLFSSLINQKVILGEIVLKSPSFESGEENLNNLIDFIQSQRDDSKDDKPSLVQLGLIKILNGSFQITPELLLSCPDLKVEFGDSSPDRSQEVKIGGTIGFMQKELAVDGAILVSSGKTTGDFKLSVDKINSSHISSLMDGAKELGVLAQLNFEVSDLIQASGQLTFISDKGRYASSPLATVNYDLNYDKSKDTLSLKSFDYDVDDILKGSFSGEIEKLTDELVFNLTGSTETLDINGFMSRMLDDNSHSLSGTLNSNDLKVSGSKAKDNIKLSGTAILKEFKYKSEQDTPSVLNADCKLTFQQNLSLSSSFSLSSNGNCTAQEFYWDKTGKVGKLASHVRLVSKDKWSDNKISLTSLNGTYMDGAAGGSLDFILASGFGGGITKISGNIKGRDLNLQKTPKKIIPADMQGEAQSASARFEGGDGNYTADISLIVNSFILKSNKGREIRISQFQTSELIDLQYISESLDNAESPESSEDRIVINGKSVSYKGLLFEEYSIDKGRVEEFSFLLDLGEDRWTLNMSSNGSGFSIIGHDVSLKQFQERLSIDNSGRAGFKGKVNGAGGRYKSVDFPQLSWDYNFINNKIEVSNVSAQVSTLGEFKTDNLDINMGEQAGGYPYKIRFTDGTFAGFEGKLNSQGIVGNFTVNRPGTTNQDWGGSVDVKKTTIVSAVIDDISNNITPSLGGINLENITGKFLGGDISGNIKIDTTRSPSGVDADLKLLDASIDSGGLNIKLKESGLRFLGTLPDQSLPEGAGSLEFKNLVIDRQGASSTLQANIKTRAVAETLYIQQGFIRGNNNQEIGFTGEMNNSLNENRTLKINTPEVNVSDVIGIFSPFVSQEFTDAKAKGYAAMDLVFHNLLYPQGSWGGKLSLRNGSLFGDFGGAPLSIQDVNGTITIKDEVSSENPLATIVGEHLKLSKSIYKKFLRSFREVNLEPDLDFLKIKKIDYGILRFEDVEVALEVDRQKLNLRRIISKFFNGNLFGAGLLRFNAEQSKYNLSLLFDEISLEGISERISPTQEYITGRVNGLVWLTGEGAQLDTINGPFKFWSKKSGKEQRKIGKALLDKLGAKERLILGSNRGYDNGNIVGYINSGLITFKEFDLSNSILGIKNLSIQADPIKNSISIAHLISVIREVARRSETGGGPTIETN